MSAPVRPAAEAPSVAAPAAPGPGGRRPWWVWAVPFTAWLAVLLVRNSYLFSRPVYEDADQGANSVLIEQARHFSLLIGNYSRVGFNHPGPAFMYVQSWGESLFWAAAHVVPAPWNGQMIGVYALNALFVAFVVAACYGWTRSLTGALLACAAAALLGALHPQVYSSDWNPYVYVPAYFAFAVAIASVAAGRVADLWIAALSGWFLIHGHVCFLLFVPALTGCAAVALGWQHRRQPGRALWSFLATQRRAWLPAVAISALFALPIALELALHWPGNFGKYLTYSSSDKAGGHGIGPDVQYALWYWWPRAGAWAVAVAVYAVAAAATWRMPSGGYGGTLRSPPRGTAAPARRFAASLLAFAALSTAALLVYAATGVDTLQARYIGFFYWTVPVTVLLALALAVASRPPSRVALGAAAAAAATALALFAAAPATRVTTSVLAPNGHVNGVDSDPGLPAAVARLAAGSGGRPIALRVGNGAWLDMTGLLVQAQRTGVAMCLSDSRYEFMVTSQFTCDRAQLADGVRYWLVSWTGVPPRGTRVVLRLRWSFVTRLGAASQRDRRIAGPIGG
jgi:hypothetical protein